MSSSNAGEMKQSCVEYNLWDLSVLDRRAVVSACSVRELECYSPSRRVVVCNDVQRNLSLTFCAIERVGTLNTHTCSASVLH